jgi:hypothetical protein
LNLTGKSIELSNSEVEKSIQRLFYWASFADKVTKAEMSLPFFKLKFFLEHKHYLNFNQLIPVFLLLTVLNQQQNKIIWYLVNRVKPSNTSMLQ